MEAYLVSDMKGKPYGVSFDFNNLKGIIDEHNKDIDNMDDLLKYEEIVLLDNKIDILGSDEEG